MEPIRKPFQGVNNIIRFNWPYYVAALSIILMLLLAVLLLPNHLKLYLLLIAGVKFSVTLSTLVVSFYIYDLSNLYTLNWLILPLNKPGKSIVNINAGFDETSILLHKKYPNSRLEVFDFYDPELHTEPSIKRARKAYPPYAGTKAIDTSSLPLSDNSKDCICLFFAAHEIRNDMERVKFFIELSRVLKDDGKIIVVEHQRDGANFLAYNLGAFHFQKPSIWKKTFKEANLIIESKVGLNPFITAFTLIKNGTTS